jgi:hypothetical protein
VIRRAGALLAVALAGALGIGGCSSAGSSSGPSADPGYYAGTLWAQRPVVQLSYDVSPDLTSATGRETGTFTPDARTCELVFRAWPNEPTMSKAGDSLTVTDTAVDGRPVAATTEADGAPDGAPPTLIRVPLSRCVNAGQPVHFDVGFRVALGRDADERTGYSAKANVAWLGTAFPLLSWVRGQGWTTDPAVTMNGESVVSEDFALSLAVTAPSGMAVQGAGTDDGSTPGPRPGTLTHHYSAPALRDVTVAFGDYQVRTEQVDGVRVHLATPGSGTRADPDEWSGQVQHAVSGLSSLFGPFPYADLWITITPGQSDGTEYPDAVQFGDSKAKDLPSLVAHELSHQWFYSLVGNDQARDPWLDESLATYGEAMVGDDGDYYTSYQVPDRVAGKMGRSMSYWADHGGFDRYTDGVYNQGAHVLLSARAQAGASRFDDALRGYVRARAHQVATPADFASAFAGLPSVVDALRTAGAFDGAGQQ